jgi:small subunit ribosomal protein S17e
MGRIKTQMIKRATHELIHQYRERFKENFDENKKVVDSVATMHGKKLRNVIAGYVTRLMRMKKE